LFPAVVGDLLRQRGRISLLLPQTEGSHHGVEFAGLYLLEEFGLLTEGHGQLARGSAGALQAFQLVRTDQRGDRSLPAENDESLPRGRAREVF
jgi:hypothetical protein